MAPQTMSSVLQSWQPNPGDRSLRASLVAGAVSLILVALLTAGLAAASLFANVDHVTSIYLIPVLVGAIRGGVLPAVVAAMAGVGTAAFFFYPPIFDFRVQSTVHIIDLALFIFVAVVTGRLATNVRRARLREQADMLREALIGSVSHELRTPLASIIGSASVLAQSPPVAQDARLAPLATGLREEAERLDEHIQNLLDASRISSEGIRQRAEWIDPGDVVNAAVERKRRLLAGHKLAVVVGEDLPLIHVDATLVDKALGQLIENAVKYSPPAGPIEVRAEQAGRSIRITVRDEGAGLTAQEQERIWDRFYRGPRHSDKVPGSGLGLWIAQALVEACGGRVTASSPGIDRGATFSLELPIQPYSEPANGGAYDE
jgi:K+-sensing histidine kinase KdpD